VLLSLPLCSKAEHPNKPSNTEKNLLKIDPFYLALGGSVAFSLGAVVLMFILSSRQVQQDQATYGTPYSPPPEAPENRRLRAQVETIETLIAKRREVILPKPKASPPPVQDDTRHPALAEADDNGETDPSGHDSDNEPERTTDVFGRPLDAPDPCAGHVMPDFSTSEWQSLCADHGIEAARCEKVLGDEWGIGSDEIHYEFELPEGCRP
jgi:hypothetical protein